MIPIDSSNVEGAEAETIELHIEADRATLVRRAERLIDGRWQASKVTTEMGTARSSSNGWILELPWEEGWTLDVGNNPIGIPANRLRLSCTRADKRVHDVDARPVNLCENGDHWTGGEREIAGWWCADVDRRMFFDGGEFFTSPPGIDHVGMMCCHPHSDVCSGWDGGYRAAR